MAEICIDILASTFSVRSADRRVIDDARSIFRAFPVGNAGRVSAGYSDALFEARCFGQSYALFRNGEKLLEENCPAYFMACLEHRLYEEAIGLDEDNLLLHAGAVAREGRGLILPGDKGAGKSTLVASLVQRGFSYLSDETAAIEYGTMKMTAVPRALHIKDARPLDAVLKSGRMRLESYGPADSDYPARYLVPPADTIARGPVEPKAIVFGAYRPSADTRLERVEGARAAREMLRQSLKPERDLRRQFELAADLLSACEACELEYSDLSEAIGVCEGLLD